MYSGVETGRQLLPITAFVDAGFLPHRSIRRKERYECYTIVPIDVLLDVNRRPVRATLSRSSQSDYGFYGGCAGRPGILRSVTRDFSARLLAASGLHGSHAGTDGRL